MVRAELAAGRGRAAVGHALQRPFLSGRCPVQRGHALLQPAPARPGTALAFPFREEGQRYLALWCPSDCKHDDVVPAIVMPRVVLPSCSVLGKHVRSGMLCMCGAAGGRPQGRPAGVPQGSTVAAFLRRRQYILCRGRLQCKLLWKFLGQRRREGACPPQIIHQAHHRTAGLCNCGLA